MQSGLNKDFVGNYDDFSIEASNRGIQELLNSRERGLNCGSCGEVLTGLFIDAYPHDGGWSILGFFEKYWLSIHCPKCGYDTSFDKLGIARR